RDQAAPGAISARSGVPALFDNTVAHDLEIAVSGSGLQVALDNRLLTFTQNGRQTTTVTLLLDGSGAAGIPVGAEGGRTGVGGQSVDNLVVSPYRALDSLPVQNNFAAPGALQFAATAYTTSEAGTLTVAVSRTSGGSAPATVRVATRDGTAQAGVDYTAVTQ